MRVGEGRNRNIRVSDKDSQFLVLISGEFPAQTGDYSFIRHEIDAMAAAFDQVFVFSFRVPTTPLTPLPSNVSYMGALSKTARLKSLTALFNWKRLGAVVASLRRELLSGRMKGHTPLVLANILTGARFSNEITSALRRESLASDQRVSVYSFWGSHGALAVPYLPKHYRKVVRLHRFDLYENSGGRLPLRASIFGEANVVLPISEHGREYLSSHFGELVESEKVSVMRLGTADHGLGPLAADTESTEARHVIRVVSCSSVIGVKRVASIAPALKLLATGVDVHWTHFGDGEKMDELESAVNDATSQNSRLQVELRGQTDHGDVLAHYEREPIDVFVNVSDSEGVPVSIMEALSFGIPVVATNAGGTGEIVAAELGSGVLLPLRPSAEKLADALRFVVENRAEMNPRAVWEMMSDARETSAKVVEVLKWRSRDHC